MKLAVLCCVFAAASASSPFLVSPVATPVLTPFGYAVPWQPPFNYAQVPTQTFSNGLHLLKKRSVTRLPVVPGPQGFSAAVAAGNIGFTTPITVDPTVFTAANIVTNPIGISAPLATGPLSVSTPIIAGSVGISAPIASFSAPVNTSPNVISAGPIPVSAPNYANAVVNAPITTVPAVISTPIVAGSIGLSAPTVPVIRSF